MSSSRIALITKALVVCALAAASVFVLPTPASAAGPVTAFWTAPTAFGAEGPPTTFVSPADTITIHSSSTNAVVFDSVRPGCTINDGSCDNDEVAFGAPTGQTLTQGSAYTGASGTASASVPQFYITGRQGPFYGGAFVIDNIAFSGQTVTAFSARWVIHNTFTGYDYEGQMSYNSTASYTPLTQTFDPSPLSLTRVNTTTTTDLQITNSGPGSLTGLIGSVLIDGQAVSTTRPDAFGISANTCTGTVVAPGASCHVTVSFSPTTLGAHNATLSFTDGIRNGSLVPQQFQLSAQSVRAFGYIAGAGGSHIDVGSARAGDDYTGPSTVTISNSINTVPLNITDVQISGANADDFDYDTDCTDAPIAAGASCTVDVYFYPSIGGTEVANYTLVSDSGNPLSFTATGHGTNGYYIASAGGSIYNYGDADPSLNLSKLNKPVVGVATTPDGDGTWRVASDGGIFATGDANFYGSTGSLHLNKPIVGMARTPDGEGYWLVASDGGIFAYGDANFYGSTGSIHLNQPIVGMTPTPDGEGYWLVASDGGIFAYGDADFHGSAGGMHLNKPVVGMSSTASGDGYWLVASDGGIFSYGDAHFFGSAGSIKLNQPIVGMTPSASGNGYLFVAKDGGIFTYGDATFYGSAAGKTTDVVGIAPTGSFY